ncbi:Hypothetical protein ETA_pET490440 (plasmid) [Erwinia tasmaniensis Et1/99]|uniref:Uncharacterized protein n=2 Tax=Erwinia tasmaniensis TaxID=338565 RepID=B2VAW6_ERWT9|nr:Hypothetical protein ETA_pET490440 [Erwinia tasmaniensis Et1/99]
MNIQRDNDMIVKNKAYDIPCFHESVKRDFESGLITLKQAATEFFKSNWTPFVDIEYTKKQLGI